MATSRFYAMFADDNAIFYRDANIGKHRCLKSVVYTSSSPYTPARPARAIQAMAVDLNRGISYQRPHTGAGADAYIRALMDQTVAHSGLLRGSRVARAWEKLKKFPSCPFPLPHSGTDCALDVVIFRHAPPNGRTGSAGHDPDGAAEASDLDSAWRCTPSHAGPGVSMDEDLSAQIGRLIDLATSTQTMYINVLGEAR